jgi:phospholipase C
MLGWMKAPDYPIDGLDGAETNEDGNETAVAVNRDAGYSGDFDPDPGHDFDDVTIQLYGTSQPAPGAEPDMSGFVKAYAKRCNGNVAASHRIMKCFAPEKLPILTGLAKQYAVCDRWFSSIPGPTLPNRLFAHAGTSGGRLDMAPEYLSGFTTIHELLDRANVSSTIYADGWSGVATIPYLLKYQTQFFASMDDFYQGCKRGKLSSYTFIEPRYGTTVDAQGVVRPESDQHPDSDVAEGENLILRVYEAIRANKKIWNSCMFVITYDEHGGLYDHVPPPGGAPNPDGKNSANPAFDFTRLGVRVPAVVVSPFVRPKTIVSDQFDHTSLLATASAILRKRPLDPSELGKRAAAANTLINCFDESLYNNPRQDMPHFGAPKTNTRPAVAPNDLLMEYVRQAALVEQSVPPAKRTGIDPAGIKTDAEAQKYIERVYALLGDVKIEAPATGGIG